MGRPQADIADGATGGRHSFRNRSPRPTGIQILSARFLDPITTAHRCMERAIGLALWRDRCEEILMRLFLMSLVAWIVSP